MLKCKIFGHNPKLTLNIDTKEIKLFCMNCGEDQSSLLDLLEGKSSITIPSEYTIYKEN